MAQRMSRRDALRTAGIGLGVLGAGRLLTGCSSGLKGSSGGGGSTSSLRIGYVSPQTGPLASFATGDNYIINKLKPVLAKGFTAGGKTWNIEVVVKDSQSTTTRATEVTQELINSSNVDIVIASATPDTANPVSDACEAGGIPNVTTIVPWEAWFFGRGKKAGEQFNYSTMFFFGMKEFTDLFLHMWRTVGVTGGPVGCLWPNDTDANAFRAGFPPAMNRPGTRWWTAARTRTPRRTTPRRSPSSRRPTPNCSRARRSPRTSRRSGSRRRSRATGRSWPPWRR
jgi:branched-chain amino acid transport system substrate-binding protein